MVSTPEPLHRAEPEQGHRRALLDAPDAFHGGTLGRLVHPVASKGPAMLPARERPKRVCFEKRLTAAKTAFVNWMVKPFGVGVFHHLSTEGMISELLFSIRLSGEPWPLFCQLTDRLHRIVDEIRSMQILSVYSSGPAVPQTAALEERDHHLGNPRHDLCAVT